MLAASVLESDVMTTLQLETRSPETTGAAMHALVLSWPWPAFQAGNLQPGKLVTHRFAMEDILKAFHTFGNAARHGALKVALRAS